MNQTCVNNAQFHMKKLLATHTPLHIASCLQLCFCRSNHFDSLINIFVHCNNLSHFFFVFLLLCFVCFFFLFVKAKCWHTGTEQKVTRTISQVVFSLFKVTLATCCCMSCFIIVFFIYLWKQQEEEKQVNGLAGWLAGFFLSSSSIRQSLGL